MEKIGSINPFGLRIERPLRAALEAAAKASGRSLNAEIVARLNESLQVVYDQRPRLSRPMVIAESAPGARIAPEEELLLAAFRSLDPHRRLAFIAFIRAIESVSGPKKRKTS